MTALIVLTILNAFFAFVCFTVHYARKDINRTTSEYINEYKSQILPLLSEMKMLDERRAQTIKSVLEEGKKIKEINDSMNTIKQAVEIIRGDKNV